MVKHREPNATAAVAREYAKAIVAFIAPGAVLIGSAVLPTSHGGEAITTAEWVTALVACLTTSAGVARIGNGDGP